MLLGEAVREVLQRLTGSTLRRVYVTVDNECQQCLQPNDGKIEHFKYNYCFSLLILTD